MKLNTSAIFYKPDFYELDPKTETIDFDSVRAKAKELKPKMILCGYSAYPRTIDFAKFREIADEVGALLMADIAHIAGLVRGGAHPSPFPHAHVVTTTTHKTLRGPRGGLILTNDEELAKAINRAVFPGQPGRAADAHHRRQGGRVRRGSQAGVQGVCAADREERQGAGGCAGEEGLSPAIAAGRTIT